MFKRRIVFPEITCNTKIDSKYGNRDNDRYEVFHVVTSLVDERDDEDVGEHADADQDERPVDGEIRRHAGEGEGFGHAEPESEERDDNRDGDEAVEDVIHVVSPCYIYQYR